MTFLLLTAPSTSTLTDAPATTGWPTFVAPPPPTSSTRSSFSSLVPSSTDRSIRIVSPVVTLNCLPPSSMIAYMAAPLALLGVYLTSSKQPPAGQVGPFGEVPHCAAAAADVK